MHFSNFSPTWCKNSPWMQLSPQSKNWVLFLPLVGNAWMKSTNASMCFSNRQRALQHAKNEIDKQDSHKFSTIIANKIGPISMWHSYDQNKAFFTKISLSWAYDLNMIKWAQTTYNSQISCKVTNSHHKIITNTYKLSHVMSMPPRHVSTSKCETSQWWTSCNGLAPKIRNLKHTWHGIIFFKHKHFIYHFHDLQIKHGTWSAFAAKRSLGFFTR
jgi:hypothetical protein